MRTAWPGRTATSPPPPPEPAHAAARPPRRALPLRRPHCYHPEVLTISGAERGQLAATLAMGRARAAARGRAVLVSVVEAVAPLDPLRVFAAAVGQERCFWGQPDSGFAFAGAGAAFVVTVDGPARFTDAEHAWRAVIEEALVTGPDIPAAAPLLIGGFGFEAGGARTSRWAGFPDARLVVPTFRVTSTDAGCWLTTSVLVQPSDDVDALALRLQVDRVHLIEDELASAAPATASAVQALVETPDARFWLDTVAQVARDIRDGAVEKVVLARLVEVVAAAPLDVVASLERLRSAYTSCYTFAFARADGGTFLGATPERLVRLRGRDVRVMSLAGSAPRGQSEAEDQARASGLAANAKDRLEHALVVRGLREALAGLCDSIAVPEAPEPLTMPNVHHLHTPISARLRAGCTLGDLLTHLHPTPAVAGWPREAALDVIREREPFDRGWYAAPVGWFGPGGDGEFAVALRSALVRGTSAALFAGCGLMGDSDPANEYAESALKLRPMLAALGAD